MRWTRIIDSQCGFRAIKKEAWQKLDLVSQGFQIETEIIYKAAKNKLAIARAPISFSWNNEPSRLSTLRDGLKTLGLLAGKLIGDIGGR